MTEPPNTEDYPDAKTREWMDAPMGPYPESPNTEVMIVGVSSDGYLTHTDGSRHYDPLAACKHFAELAEAAEERAELAPDPHRMRELEREVERVRAELDEQERIADAYARDAHGYKTACGEAEVRLDRAESVLTKIAGDHNRCGAGHVKAAQDYLNER
jgi:hypothetical protein